MVFQKIKLQMIEERRCEYVPSKISNANDVVNAINVYEQLELSPMEKVIAIGLNTTNEIVCYYDVAMGAHNCCDLDIKNVVTPLLISGANKLILVHNHPSGHCKSSQQDFDVSTRVKFICDILKIQFLDHLVIAKDGFCRCI